MREKDHPKRSRRKQSKPESLYIGADKSLVPLCLLHWAATRYRLMTLLRLRCNKWILNRAEPFYIATPLMTMTEPWNHVFDNGAPDWIRLRVFPPTSTGHIAS